MSDEAGSTCPKCKKTNPVGAKFCSGCATNLSPTPTPQPTPSPIPPPPPISRHGAMMGSFGGKSTSRQFEGEANTLYNAVVGFVEAQAGSEIKHQAPPQQISVDLIFKEFMTTLSAPIKVASEIQITPTAPGQCSVAIKSKVDWSSTTSIWLVTLAVFVVMMVLNPLFIFMWLLIGVLGSALNAWMLSSRAPTKVADELFEYLRSHANESHANNQTAQNLSHKSKPELPLQPLAEGEAPMARIKKLAELKELGAITAEEFDEKKAELLKRI